MFPPVIDNVMRSKIASCMRSFYYGHVRNLSHFEGKSIHLHAGGVFATGLEIARKSFYVAGNTQEKAIAEAKIAMKKAWDEPHPDYPETLLKKKGLLRLLGALDYYFERWPLATDFIKPHITPTGEHCIEFRFALPLPILHPDTGQPLLYAGRCDMICDYHGQLVIEDDKTTATLGQQWINNWTHDSQPTGYCWAAQQMGHAVTGAVIRGVSILSDKVDKKTGEALLGMSYGGAQAVLTRSPWQIERWHTQLCRDIERAIAAYREGWWDFAIDKHSCNAYGGCPFSGLCSNRDPEPFIESEFKEVVWNPLD